MTNKLQFDLDAINVKTPCHVPWETMTGDDRVRHCASCKLNVYNLSDMTRAQAENLILSREGRLCIRLYRRADGTVLTRDCSPIRARRARRLAAAAVACSLILLTGGISVAALHENRRQAIDQIAFVKLRQSRMYRYGLVKKTVDWADAMLFPPPPAVSVTWGALYE